MEEARIIQPNQLQQAYKAMLLDCMGLKQDEEVLIITDAGKKDLAKELFQEAFEHCKGVKLMEIPMAEVHGQEPPAEAAQAMKEFPVVLLITSFSLSHTKARLDATKMGARVASMPTITREIIQRCVPVDYTTMKERTDKFCDVLDKGRTLTIQAKAGTDLECSIAGREGLGRDAGRFLKKGESGNIPGAEAFIAPVEGTTHGTLVIDASIACVGKVAEPVTIGIEQGIAKTFTGRAGTALQKKLAKVGELAFHVAEIGIGTNEKAIITGNILEDEKVLGTAHLAFGNNKRMGGTIDVPIHLDCVFKKPTILIDGTVIMEEGNLLI